MSATVVETVRPLPELVSLPIEDPQQYNHDRLKPYVHPPETKEEIPWAELVALDLEDLANPGSKERLAEQLEHAVRHVGFFYVKKLWAFPGAG
jgi:hypothetical protein